MWCVRGGWWPDLVDGGRSRVFDLNGCEVNDVEVDAVELLGEFITVIAEGEREGGSVINVSLDQLVSNVPHTAGTFCP